MIPELPSLLFTPDNYVAVLHKAEDEYGDWVEHKLVSACGKAAVQLEQLGISFDLIRNVHFSYFAFDFDRYKEELMYRCDSHLRWKSKNRVVKYSAVERMARLLLRHFKYIDANEEFSLVSREAECVGIPGEETESPQEKDIQSKNPNESDFSISKFCRELLIEFLHENPYLRHLKEEYTTSGSDDIDLLYTIGLSIFASKPNVPIEFEFTEFQDAHRPMDPESVEAFLLDLRHMLQSRSMDSANAFGRIYFHSSKPDSEITSFERVVIQTSKEKGDLLERLTTEIFSSQTGFKVKRNMRRPGEEIDLVVINKLSDPFWSALQSPTILVECKNQIKKVEAKDLRNFEGKMLDRKGLCKLGIFVSSSGFTKGCQEVASKCRRDGHIIILIDNKLLQKLTDEQMTTADWLEEIILEQC